MVASADYDPVVVEVPLSSLRLSELIELGKRRRESAKLDFKESHNPSVTRDKVELTKDLVAMANTAGGYVVVGIDNSGVILGLDYADAARLDDAKLRQQVHSYIGVSLELFFEAPEWEGKTLGVITVLRSPRAPLVFQKNGQYPDVSGRSLTVFREGDVFVRHGSSSERWNQNDVQTLYARVVERERERWLREVLPDLLRAAANGTPTWTLDVADARTVLSQDAEAFERTVRGIVRRLP